MDIHKKLQIAQERLNTEHDIQHIIEMNRVTSLIQKTRILARQRSLLSVYGRHYVISAEDITRLNQKEAAPPKAPKDPDVEKSLMFERVVADFDGETNEIDRRIYYEVTGEQLIEGEFADTNSSNSDYGGEQEEEIGNILMNYHQLEPDGAQAEHQVALIGNGDTDRDDAAGGDTDSTLDDGKSPPITIN